MDGIVKNNIDDLANVEVPLDLIDKLDIRDLSTKVKSIVESLNNAGNNMQQLRDQGFWRQKWNNFNGDNTRSMANAEKAVVDASIFNVALSCLLVLFSKALKQQQNEIVVQQTSIKNQQDEILKLQGLTKEQADSIIKLLEADNFVTNLIEVAKIELNNSINNLRNEYAGFVNQTNSELKLFNQKNVSNAEKISNIEAATKDLELSIREASKTLHGDINTIEMKIKSIDACIIKSSTAVEDIKEALTKLADQVIGNMSNTEIILENLSKKIQNNYDEYKLKEIVNTHTEKKHRLLIISNMLLTAIIIVYFIFNRFVR